MMTKTTPSKPLFIWSCPSSSPGERAPAAPATKEGARLRAPPDASLQPEYRGTFNCDAALLFTLPNALINIARAGHEVSGYARLTQTMLYAAMAQGDLLMSPADLAVAREALEAVGWEHDAESDGDALLYGHTLTDGDDDDEAAE